MCKWHCIHGTGKKTRLTVHHEGDGMLDWFGYVVVGGLAGQEEAVVVAFEVGQGHGRGHRRSGGNLRGRVQRQAALQPSHSWFGPT